MLPPIGLHRISMRDMGALFGHEAAAHAYEYVGHPGPDEVGAAQLDTVKCASIRRQRTFVAGRLCAGAALNARGFAPRPLLSEPTGQPAWPPSAIGSIAHTEGYAIAAVLADERPESGLGVDVESVSAVSRDLSSILFTASEKERLAFLDDKTWAAMAGLMFCAKEAYYKAQFTVTGAWVDFHDVEVCVEPGVVMLRPASDLDALAAVQWPVVVGHTMRGDMVVTAVLLSKASR